ncbi:MAG: carboxypeptidase-like regulatory domain-containing protein, partial [Chitinophagaceae bacterium]
MNKVYAFLFLMCIGLMANAQNPAAGGMRGGGAGRMGGANLNVGRFYGKMVDSKTNKGVGGITLQLLGNKFDTVTKQMKQAILKTVITESNGDFSIEGLSVLGNFKLKATAVGYKTLEKPLSFGIKMPAPGTTPDFQQMMAQADKDLGNIKVDADAADLGNVTVTSSAKPFFEMGIDRKVFNVDKNLVSTGQTATEIMKTIPSLSVDID